MMRYLAKLTLAAALVCSALVVAPNPASGQDIGIEEFEEMQVPTRWRIERGERIYDEQCAECHGDDGTGLESYPDQKFANPIPDLTDREYRYGGGVIEIYNVLTEGPPEAHHPTFRDELRYQERWAVSHFVRAWSQLGQKPTAETAAKAARAATDGPADPPEVRERARIAAEEGRCARDVMKKVQEEIGSQLEPKGEEQLERGKKLYADNGCAACHGEKGGVADAMKDLPIPPRDFQSPDANWQKGPNALTIFNTLTNGARGQMRSYKNQIDPEGRWAIAHFLLERWIPEEAQSEVGDSQLRDLCRQRSSSSAPDPMWTWDRFDSKRAAVDYAMQRLAADAPEQRVVKLRNYGPVELAEGANKARGEELYREQCVQCHGAAAQGGSLGPFGVERVIDTNRPLPRLRIQVRGLEPAHAAGTFREFAERSTSGVHATLPEMTGPSLMRAQNWKDLQAFVASIETEDDENAIRPDIREISEPKPGTEGGPDAGTTGGSAPSTAPDAGTTGGSGASTAPSTGSTGNSAPSTAPDAGSSAGTNTATPSNAPDAE